MTRFFPLFALLVLLLSAGAGAHKGEKHGGAEPAQEEAAAAETGEDAVAAGGAPSDAVSGTPVADAPAPLARLTNWVGRFHPAVVHFPLALVPMALGLGVLARRRGGDGAAARLTVQVAAVGAVVASLLGWLLSVPAWWDADTVMALHRWVGTGVAVVLAILGFGVTRRPASMVKSGTLATLALLTAALLVQGWLGGSLVHGVDHLAY